MSESVRSLGDLMTDARVLLQDTRSPFRYREADLYTGLNAALMQARRLRPDLFLGRFGREKFNYAPADSAQPFPLAPWYWEAAVEFVVGRAELREDEFTNDGRAVALLNRFRAKLLTMEA